MYLLRCDLVKCQLSSAIVAIAILSCSPSAAVAQCPALDNHRPERGVSTDTARHEPPLRCRVDPVLTRLFTPRDVPPGTYVVYVTSAPIDRVAMAFRTNWPPAGESRAWKVERAPNPLNVFGDAGEYDKSKVARLYTGARMFVARGPVVERGQTVASITLASPYPDPTLARVEPGTLIIEFRIPKELR